MMKITVIMPTYNDAESIKTSILSLFGQTYEDWELLIVDDGSTDDTGAVDLHTIANICAASTMSAILNAITVPLGESSYLVNVGDKTGKGIYYEFICQSFSNWLYHDNR